MSGLTQFSWLTVFLIDSLLDCQSSWLTPSPWLAPYTWYWFDIWHHILIDTISWLTSSRQSWTTPSRLTDFVVYLWHRILIDSACILIDTISWFGTVSWLIPYDWRPSSFDKTLPPSWLPRPWLAWSGHVILNGITLTPCWTTPRRHLFGRVLKLLCWYRLRWQRPRDCHYLWSPPSVDWHYEYCKLSFIPTHSVR